MKSNPNLFNAAYCAEQASKHLIIAGAMADNGYGDKTLLHAKAALRDLDKAREQLVMALEAGGRRAA